MNITEYQKNSNRTNAILSDKYSDMTAIHMVMGMTTEVGEITDVYKKNLAYGKEIDLVNVKEEIGDLMWYISELCNYYDWDLEEILGMNIAKLKKRFPEKFDKEKAIDRDVNEERKLLDEYDDKFPENFNDESRPMPPDISII